ncbi:macrophage-expressed gene 1 protein-like isoform X1 [Sycon ciliatum]|uniref:macrophage-expressed gene 1 protein-like isoform X1 n=1 Tax=Sycon ciliatum TaxID=27933 RepID=UPI0031F61422
MAAGPFRITYLLSMAVLGASVVTGEHSQEQSSVEQTAGTGAAAGSVPSRINTANLPVKPDWMVCAEATGVSMRLEALPGTGWDNLNNKNMGYVADMSYNTCRVTPDGNFLIPDNVLTIPLKLSQVQEFSDMYSDFRQYRSTTSQSMKLDVSYEMISGSFSEEYQSNKANQVKSKSTTTRASLRHQIYEVDIKPDATLAPALKQRLLLIADMIHNNQSRMADYELQLIIRDYGTYMIRSVIVGGAFTQETQVTNKFVESKSQTEASVKASASAGFMISIGFQFNYTVSNEEIQNFQANRTQSTTRTFGGPPYAPGLSVNDWEQGLMNNLVAVDKQGDPIEFMITSAALPELPAPTVIEIASRLATASREYMTRNTHRGCTDVNSPSFNYKANSGEASLCKNASNNYTFAGVFQNCSSTYSYNRDLCPRFLQKNPLSGDFSCPLYYEPVYLHEGTYTESWTVPSCHIHSYDCGFWGIDTCYKRVCHSRGVSATATYQTYWCVATGKVPKQHGFLFGGVYSNSTPNPVSSGQSCPQFFIPLLMGHDLKVCVSNDYERGAAFSVPFAGFFSCQVGNPLAILPSPSEKATPLDKVGYGLWLGPESWPHLCPHGYAQHLADIDESCEINYCVIAHAFDQPTALLLNRPPYGKQPPNEGNVSYLLIVTESVDGRAWFRNDTNMTWQEFHLLPFKPIPINDSRLDSQSQASADDKSKTTHSQATVLSAFVLGLLVAGVVVQWSRLQ